MDKLLSSESLRNSIEMKTKKYIEESFKICSGRCLTNLKTDKVTVNEEKCMVNCSLLRNNFWYEQNIAMNEFLKTEPTTFNQMG